MYSRSGTLLGRDACRALYCVDIPRTRNGKILGEDNLATVDDVVTEDERNTQTALLNRHLLQA